jgi:hypothetical protein
MRKASDATGIIVAAKNALKNNPTYPISYSHITKKAGYTGLSKF